MNLRPPPDMADPEEMLKWQKDLYEFLKHPVFHNIIFKPTGSTTWNPGNLADGAGETKSITVTGASLGDYVIVAAPYDLQDCTVTGYVQAANKVEIRLQNESGGAKDLASGTWNVMVIRQ